MEKRDYTRITCPMELTMHMIAGKWKLVILWHLAVDEVKRYGEIKKSIPNITHKVLSSQLKELEKDDLIIRKEYLQVPPKVEYCLSKKGKTLIPILNDIFKWGQKYL
ncbi:helix-turn-helix domain-containing protein [Clostridium oceanicum]|uniref:Transcriptional activator HxlR n=1 Tax=Clostridium oceanicum TaxID=1543 RepID=A0ABN1JGK2_9CLOT